MTQSLVPNYSTSSATVIYTRSNECLPRKTSRHPTALIKQLFPLHPSVAEKWHTSLLYPTTHSNGIFIPTKGTNPAVRPKNFRPLKSTYCKIQLLQSNKGRKFTGTGEKKKHFPSQFKKEKKTHPHISLIHRASHGSAEVHTTHVRERRRGRHFDDAGSGPRASS